MINRPEIFDEFVRYLKVQVIGKICGIFHQAFVIFGMM